MIPTDIVLPIRLTRQFPDADKCLQRCCECLLANTRNFRVIFVDDNSDAVGQQVIENIVSTHFRNSLMVRTYKQRWFTRAVNIGLRLTRTPWVVVLNSDAYVQPGWLEELMYVRDDAKNLTKVGLVGSVYSPEDPRRWMSSVDKDYVTGHCWYLNMEALTEVSVIRNTPGIYLDELRDDSIHIRSDVYLCWDMNRLGWQTIKSHHSHVDHEAGKSWGHLLGLIPNSVNIVNEVY